MLQKLQWDSLQLRRARSRVLMLYRVRHGLVAIPTSVHLQPVAAHTRGSETRYRQLQCHTNTYSQTFFPSTICLWSTLPVDVCELPPDSFKAPLNTAQLMWMAPALFLIHLAPLHRFYLLLLFSTPFCTAVPRHEPVPTSRCEITRLRVGTLLEEEEQGLNSQTILGQS